LKAQINAVRRTARERFAVPTGKIEACSKFANPEFWRKTEKNNRMNARPQVREILIARKLQRWSAIAKCPLIDLRCPPARARKNYQRLFYRYRELAEKIGLHQWSAF
jgi:hypothetical protein